MNSKKCRKEGCGVPLVENENWYPAHVKHAVYICKDCHSGDRKRNTNRMYVNGKYIPKSHPMHKPGRYVANEGSFFDVVPEDDKPLSGWVYIITNEAWPEWVKVGMADDPEKRLSGYQTSSPMRDYALFEAYNVGDRRAAEKAAHDILKDTYTKKGEWFKCNPAVADVLIRGTMGEF